MRHFVPLPVEPQTLRRLLDAAHAAPSVGLSQPWRFIRITLPELRQQIHELVQQERARTAEALKDRGDEFLRLKIDGKACLQTGLTQPYLTRWRKVFTLGKPPAQMTPAFEPLAMTPSSGAPLLART